jgi:putative methionine-R-sulfoxide reductase with GAF domain
MPKSETVRRLAEILDTTEDREVRARHAAQAIREARDYRWVGIFDAGDTELELIAHTGPDSHTAVHFENTHGMNGEAVSKRDTVVGDKEIVVPVLAAEVGTVMGTLDVESANALAGDDREFLEACAMALMPLFE